VRWQDHLQQWTAEGLIEPAVTERIRAYEAEQDQTRGLRWPVLLAIALGGLLLGAGLLLFVAAHWDALSPSVRFSLVLTLVAIFHVTGALTERFSALSVTLHAVGTACLGAGIFLTGQIFNLQEHWPAGLMLWALGGWIAWGVLRHWPQAALVALLTPMWICAEWIDATRNVSGSEKIMFQGLLLLAITYFTAITPENQSSARKALAWIGALALLPLAAVVPEVGSFAWRQPPALRTELYVLAWALSIIAPLAVAWRLRGAAVWMNFIAAVWVLALGASSNFGRPDVNVAAYAAWAAGSVGLIAWGLREERKVWINVGIAGFALTVLFFYFSNVMDKLGRSASLVGLGLLFLMGGWLLETVRRRLIARMECAS